MIDDRRAKCPHCGIAMSEWFCDDHCYLWCIYCHASAPWRTYDEYRAAVSRPKVRRILRRILTALGRTPV
jgi:hypothetical protein